MSVTSGRVIRFFAVTSLAVAPLLAGFSPDAVAADDPCHIATIDLKILSSSHFFLWDLDFDVDPAAAGGPFLKSDGVLDCEFLLDGCSGCPGGSGTLDEMTGSATFSTGAGFDGLYAGDTMFRCHVATDGTLPLATDFAVNVTSATGSATSPLDPPEPATVTVGVSSVSCGAGCPEWPRAGCRSAGSSSLLIDPFKSRKLIWKWKKGDAFGLADLSDPTTTGHYTVCMYPFNIDDTGYPKFLEEQRLPLVTGWRTLGSRGYQYRDDLQSQGPVRRLKLKGGKAGHTSLQLRSDNPREDFVPATGVTMQLVDPRNDLCWESRYSGYAADSSRFEGTTGN